MMLNFFYIYPFEEFRKLAAAGYCTVHTLINAEYLPFPVILFCRDRIFIAQMDIQEKIAKLAADLPYDRAVEHFTELTGIEVSSLLVMRTLNAIGEKATVEVVIPDSEEIIKRVNELSAGSVCYLQAKRN